MMTAALYGGGYLPLLSSSIMLPYFSPLCIADSILVVVSNTNTALESSVSASTLSLWTVNGAVNVFTDRFDCVGISLEFR